MTPERAEDPVDLAELATAPFRTSSRSSGTGSCVAVASVRGWVGVQDTKQHPDSSRRTILAFPSSAFAQFLAAVRAGRFAQDTT